MRMHPRRHGAYNVAARTASFIVNERHKNKRNTPNDGSGCVTVIFIFVILLIILNACAKL